MTPKGQSRRFRRIQKWSRAIPELAAYEDEAACIEDWKRVFRRLFFSRYAVVLLLPFAVVGAGMPLATHAAIRIFPQLGLYAGAVGGGIIGGLAPATAMWLFRKRVRQLVRERLLARGIHTCVKCAYNLRGLTTPRCPECGRPFDPQSSL